MENNRFCKYYEKIIEEISRQTGPIIFSKHNCNYSYYDNNGNFVVIKTCMHFDSFKNCKFYESENNERIN
jgi:hypothetical protein